MSPIMMPSAGDPIRPGATSAVTIIVDGETVTGVLGQSIAGVVMAHDVVRLRNTRDGKPRGVFCGIGVCFDCLVTVNGVADVRACQRRASDGDEVATVTAWPKSTRASDAQAGDDEAAGDAGSVTSASGDESGAP